MKTLLLDGTHVELSDRQTVAWLKKDGVEYTFNLCAALGAIGWYDRNGYVGLSVDGLPTLAMLKEAIMRDMALMDSVTGIQEWRAYLRQNFPR